MISEEYNRITKGEGLLKDFNYTPITLDLTIARNNVPQAIAGDIILFKSISDMQCGFGIRINKTGNDFIRALQGDIIQIPTGFDRVFFTNNVGVGNANLIIGTNIDFRIRERATFNTVRTGLDQENVLVGVLATLIPIVANVLQDRVVMAIYNLDPANIVYIGNIGVTVANGYPIPPLTSMVIEIEQGVNLYGITAIASNVRILQGS